MRRIFFITIIIFTFSYIAKSQSPPVVKWQKCYGGRFVDEGRDFQQTPDGGFIIGGNTQSKELSGYHGRKDILVVKTDTAGKIVWQKVLGGSQDEELSSIILTKDGGYIFSATTHSNDGDVTYNHLANDIWVVKLNKAGGIVWQKSFGGKGNDEPGNIIQTTDGGYMVAGRTNSEDGDAGNTKKIGYKCWLIKLGSNGEMEWQKVYGGKSNDGANVVRQTHDGGYLMAAQISGHNPGGDVSQKKGGWDIWIVKLTHDGTIQWEKTYGGTESDIPNDLQLTSDGGCVVVGSTDSDNGDVMEKRGTVNDYWILKLDASGKMDWQKTFGGSLGDVAYSVAEDQNGYVVAGTTWSHDGDVKDLKGDYDCWLIKLDIHGTLLWEKAIGGSNADKAFSVRKSNDGGLLIAGQTVSADGDITNRIGAGDMLLVKLKE